MLASFWRLRIDESPQFHPCEPGSIEPAFDDFVVGSFAKA
jgi:hypothetical protein